VEKLVALLFISVAFNANADTTVKHYKFVFTNYLNSPQEFNISTTTTVRRSIDVYPLNGGSADFHFQGDNLPYCAAKSSSANGTDHNYYFTLSNQSKCVLDIAASVDNMGTDVPKAYITVKSKTFNSILFSDWQAEANLFVYNWNSQYTLNATLDTSFSKNCDYTKDEGCKLQDGKYSEIILSPGMKDDRAFFHIANVISRSAGGNSIVVDNVNKIYPFTTSNSRYQISSRGLKMTELDISGNKVRDFKLLSGCELADSDKNYYYSHVIFSEQLRSLVCAVSAKDDKPQMNPATSVGNYSKYQFTFNGLDLPVNEIIEMPILGRLRFGNKFGATIYSDCSNSMGYLIDTRKEGNRCMIKVASPDFDKPNKKFWYLENKTGKDMTISYDGKPMHIFPNGTKSKEKYMFFMEFIPVGYGHVGDIDENCKSINNYYKSHLEGDTCVVEKNGWGSQHKISTTPIRTF
jgi:hypothetical protein